jgi:hypothetical protein
VDDSVHDSSIAFNLLLNVGTEPPGSREPLR